MMDDDIKITLNYPANILYYKIYDEYVDLFGYVSFINSDGVLFHIKYRYTFPLPCHTSENNALYIVWKFNNLKSIYIKRKYLPENNICNDALINIKEISNDEELFLKKLDKDERKLYYMIKEQ